MCIIAAPIAATVAGGATPAVAAAAANAALMSNLMITMSVASTAVGFMGQQQQANAQNAMAARRQELGTARALENYANQTRQARDRQLQEREAAAHEINTVHREARRRIATAQVAAGEGGVAGASLTHLMNDFHRKDLEFATNVNRNLQFREANIEDQLESIRSGTQGQIENLMYMPTPQPSFLGAGLRIGSSVLGAYAQYKSITGWGGSQMSGQMPGYGPGNMGPPAPGSPDNPFVWGGTPWRP